ncbi:MAG: PAS domain S-box protein, partial [Methanobacterium sp.]
MEKTYKSIIENQFKAFDNMLEGVSVYKLIFNDKGEAFDAKLEYINHSTVETMDLSPKNAVGKNASQLFSDDYLNPIFKSINEFLKTGKFKRLELYYPPTDKYFIISGFYISNDYFAVIRIDITERKHAEVALKDICDNLEEKIEERTVELKKANDSLKESQEKYKQFFEASPNFTVHVGLNGKIIDANRAALEILGKSKDELIGTNFTEIDMLLKEDVPVHLKNFLKLLMGKHVDHYETRIKRSDGEIRWGDTYPIILRRYKIPTSILVISHDITDRKRAEEKLKESEEKFRLIFDEAEDSIVLNEMLENGLPGKIIEANEVTTKRLGYTKEELLNMTPKDIVAPEMRAEMSKNAQQLQKTGHAVFENIHITKKGQRIPVEINNHIMEFRGKEIALTVVRDITERKRAEEELQRSKESFRTLAENSPDLIFRVDKDLRCIYINPIITEYTNMPSKFFIGKTIDEFGFPEEYTSHFKEDYIELFKSGEKQNLEYKLPTAHGNRFFYATNVPEYNAKEDIQTALSVVRDITERKHAEEQLKETIQELERSNQELQSFAYITSHDLQEPLRTMGSYAGLLKRRYGGQLDQDADDFIEYIVSGASRMQTMIKSLLDYSRIGTKGKEFTKFNAENALNTALSNLQSSIEECDAEITHDAFPDITADESQIRQVFQNLIGNALKFSKEGVRPMIHVSAQNKDDEYVFSVSDNGIGIEEKYSDRIFEVFKRLHAIGEYQGAGIGLAIVKRIIDRHGGRIWVESELGKGSTFYFS